MFERSYALRHFYWPNGEGPIDDEINAAVARLDHPRAAASVACMTVIDEQVYLLIEYWREQPAAQPAKPAKAASKPSTEEDVPLPFTQSPESIEWP